MANLPNARLRVNVIDHCEPVRWFENLYLSHLIYLSNLNRDVIKTLLYAEIEKVDSRNADPTAKQPA